jgi:pimeloyl-ACP methyl ester carboxylesterase
MLGPREQFAVLQDRGIRLHYRDWGGRGTPVVLIHGLSSNSRIWDLTAPRLIPGHWVVALDQRGHGLSDKPDDGYGFDSVCADLAAFVQYLRMDRPVVVGHSWGGAVAVQFAAEYPDLVRGLVLVDGGFIERPPGTPWEEAEREMRPPDIDGLPATTFVGFMRKWPQLEDIWTEEIGEMVLSNFEVRADGTIARRLTIDNHMKIARALFEQRPTDLFTELGVPALLVPAVRDAEDEAAQRWQDYRERGIARIRQANPAVAVAWLHDTIHDVPVHRPRELAGLIADFTAGIS